MSFSQKANMHRHRMRHNGVKPYECRHCEKRFFRKDQMQEHSMTHIRMGIDFACPVAFCTHRFSQYTTLRSVYTAGYPSSIRQCTFCIEDYTQKTVPGYVISAEHAVKRNICSTLMYSLRTTQLIPSNSAE
ncbi:hypothetical protein V3C99_018339 [Haemonchus contortus]